MRDKHRWEEIDSLPKFEAFEFVEASDHVVVKVLPTRCVDTFETFDLRVINVTANETILVKF